MTQVDEAYLTSTISRLTFVPCLPCTFFFFFFSSSLEFLHHASSALRVFFFFFFFFSRIPYNNTCTVSPPPFCTFVSFTLCFVFHCASIVCLVVTPFFFFCCIVTSYTYSFSCFFSAHRFYLCTVLFSSSFTCIYIFFFFKHCWPGFFLSYIVLLFNCFHSLQKRKKKKNRCLLVFLSYSYLNCSLFGIMTRVISGGFDYYSVSLCTCAIHLFFFCIIIATSDAFGNSSYLTLLTSLPVSFLRLPSLFHCYLMR